MTLIPDSGLSRVPQDGIILDEELLRQRNHCLEVFSKMTLYTPFKLY